MRDLLAAVVAVVLVVAALSLATSLTYTRLRRRRSADSERARGRTIIAELPIGEDLTLVSEDATHFHYGDQAIAKDSILAARVLVNGSPIAAAVSTRVGAVIPQPTSFEDHPEGIARDRWDVAVETEHGTVLMECGAIRERVSQEMARKIFDRVKASLD